MFDSITQTVVPSTRPNVPDESKGTVLIAEDNLDFRELLAFLLENRGYTVVEASDGKEALRLAMDTHPDLIVTDLGLPAMNGFDLVRHVRANNGHKRDLKILMLTAYDRPEYIETARNVGCDVVLSKPVDLDKFEDVLTSLH